MVAQGSLDHDYGLTPGDQSRATCSARATRPSAGRASAASTDPTASATAYAALTPPAAARSGSIPTWPARTTQGTLAARALDATPAQTFPRKDCSSKRP